jgi:hypothetical protein
MVHRVRGGSAIFSVGVAVRKPSFWVVYEMIWRESMGGKAIPKRNDGLGEEMDEVRGNEVVFINRPHQMLSCKVTAEF